MIRYCMLIWGPFESNLLTDPLPRKCIAKSATLIENGELGMCLSALSTYVEQNQLLSPKMANWACVYQHCPHLQSKISDRHRKWGMCLSASSTSAEQSQLLSSKMANLACVYQHYSHLQGEASYCHRKWRIGHLFISIIPICRAKPAAVIENGELNMCLSASPTYAEQTQLLTLKSANWLCIYQHRPHLQNKFSYCHRK